MIPKFYKENEVFCISCMYIQCEDCIIKNKMLDITGCESFSEACLRLDIEPYKGSYCISLAIHLGLYKTDKEKFIEKYNKNLEDKE